MDYNLIWFILLGVLLAGYAILDGFDLGVGILHLLARDDHERRLFVNSIGPLWDGNEVWLVTFGGALFATFPEAYATIFSGFYMAFMLLLFALIFRAVSLEFRSKITSIRWRTFWDYGFFASSLLATLLFGVAVGNALRGVPLDERGLYTGGFWTLLGPYPILVGLLTVAIFAMHGAMYLYLKTEGAVQERLGKWMWHTWGSFPGALPADDDVHAGVHSPRHGPLRGPPVDRDLRGGERAGHRQHPAGALHAQVRAGLRVVDAHHRQLGGIVRGGALPRHRAGQQRGGELVDDVHGVLEPEDPGDRADHRRDRLPVRADLHRGDLLDVPRQGHARGQQLLSAHGRARRGEDAHSSKTSLRVARWSGAVSTQT